MARSAALANRSCRRPFHSQNARRRAELPLETPKSTAKYCPKLLPSLTIATRQCVRTTAATSTSLTSAEACVLSALSTRSTTTRPQEAIRLHASDSNTVLSSSFKIPARSSLSTWRQATHQRLWLRGLAPLTRPWVQSRSDLARPRAQAREVCIREGSATMAPSHT